VRALIIGLIFPAGLEILQKRVAPSAFHNSAHRVDPPRCHPDTRVAIQKQIYDWIVLDLLVRQTWIMWMHGAAGAGKSAIMQSVADLCEKAKIPLASFFFFRTDPARNSLVPFIATLVYQLIQKIPQARDEIFAIIESNPLIFDESLESQLEKLVIQPLLQLQKHLKRYFVVMIDGLDECTERAHQSDLIKLLGGVSRSRTIPVIFLVTSRREPQIEAAFVRKQNSDLVTILSLDNSDIEQTSDDIRLFLTDKFLDITETHIRRHLLPANWPPASMVEEIVTKSSGQFIYASVVISYVSSPRGNPAHLLDIVRGIRLREATSQNPFTHLDALYQHIFSQVEALDKVLDILAYVLITEADFIQYIEDAFLLEAGGLEVCLADLISVISIEPLSKPAASIKFLHASLPDFLRDKSRSEKYYINVEEYLPKLLCMFLNRVPLIVDPLSPVVGLNVLKWQEYYRLRAIKDLLGGRVQASDKIRRSFMTFNTKFYEDNFKNFLVSNVVQILQRLKDLVRNSELNICAVQCTLILSFNRISMTTTRHTIMSWTCFPQSFQSTGPYSIAMTMRP
jgi:hypothetical protein